MILDTFNSLNDRRVAETQPQIINANIKAFGSSDTRYSVRMKSGAIIPNVNGPSGLHIGESVVLSVYPGKNKKFIIIGKAGGASESTITRVKV